MMFPSLSCPTMTQRFVPSPNKCSLQPKSFNCPEENDETVSEDNLPSILSEPRSNHHEDPHSLRRQNPVVSMSESAVGFASELTQSSSGNGKLQLPHGTLAGYDPATPFPSWEEGCSSAFDPHKGAWLHPSFASSFSEYPNSLPACLPSGGYSSFPEACAYPPRGSHSPPDQSSYSAGSLEQPQSLRSILPNFATHNYHLPPSTFDRLKAMPAAPGVQQRSSGWAPGPHHGPRPEYHLPYRPPGPYHCRLPEAHPPQSVHPHPRQNNKTAPTAYPCPPSTCFLCSGSRRCLAEPVALSSPLVLGKVFVTYEADSDSHVNEIIKFVALLRHNGFDTRIDVFEQQFRSISKIDFMEKFITEKDYLIIIVISPKYFETVSGAHISMENDERTLNTVYIHKQLQNEFIQNGSRNFRFIPILFPGAKKCHVPAWLQNTQVYSWPNDRDDVLRRLMRVEKYNPLPLENCPPSSPSLCSAPL